MDALPSDDLVDLLNRLNKRLHELEKRFDSLEVFCLNTIDVIKKRHLAPYKCYVCEGQGELESILNRKPCHACGGKGILWSPSL